MIRLKLATPSLIAAVIFWCVTIAAQASTVPIPTIPPMADDKPLSSTDYKIFRDMSRFTGVPAPIPLLPKRKVTLPRVGEKTSYSAPVTKDLARAFQAQMRGDTEAALKALDRAGKAGRKSGKPDTRTAFEISMLRTQIFIHAGRTGDAERELRRATVLEIKLFGTNINSRALRGEYRFWTSDIDGAMSDLAQVAVATRHWSLPTSYRAPPDNLGALFNITNGQIRAFGLLAVIHLQQGDIKSALAWAERAEASVANVFAVTDHPLYRMFVPFHADGYYGRAINLAVLGTARLSAGKDRDMAIPLFKAAHGFLDAIGFEIPKITIDGLHAQGLITAGDNPQATRIATRAANQARRRGLADLVWRIEALLGEALLKDNRKTEAEAAFRRAQTAVEAASGALATDRAKRRFGIGKDDITRRLVEFSIARNDMGGVFRILERGRARAFVDMLAGRAVANGPAPELSQQIRELDGKLRRLRLSASSPAGAYSGQKLKNLRTTESGLIKRRQQLTDRLREKAPDLADVLSIHNRELSHVQAALEPGHIMIYGLPSAAAGAAMRLMVVSRDKAQIRALKISHNGLRNKIHLLKRFGLAGAAIAEQDRIVAEIGSVMGIADWGATRALYVVPTGQLYFVPWGALDISVPVAVLPVGGWLKRQSRTSPGSNNVVVGDPEFFGGMARLPGAREEARKIGAQYDVEPLLGDAARESRLRDRIGDGAQMVHIATHAIFDPIAPLKSALILSGDGKSEALTAAEIYERPIAARIVILSACETGAGKAIAGDDFLGLARSFYLGGATTVVNSLWPVSDKGTLAFMENFHKILPHRGAGVAWLAARDDLQARGFPPFVYGAFVVGGSLGP